MPEAAGQRLSAEATRPPRLKPLRRALPTANDRLEERREEAQRDLVLAADRVLKAFRSGHHPTLDQLDKLEGALFPFVEDKICGHGILEECDCGHK